MAKKKQIMGFNFRKRWYLPALVIAGVAASLIISKFVSPLKAEAQFPGGSVKDILVVPVQLQRDIFGVAMVDTTSQTIWIYEFDSRSSSHNRLKLWASRSWRYDRLLKQYNTAEPKPEQVKILLDSLYEGQEEKK